MRVKFYGDRPRGNPPSRKLNTRGVAISNAISRKRCKIGAKLVLITNRKLHYELSIGTKLGDLG